jgi:hypothetical protein
LVAAGNRAQNVRHCSRRHRAIVPSRRLKRDQCVAQLLAPPSNHRARLNENQRAAPTASNLGRAGPEKSIDGRQRSSLAMAVECGQLAPESGRRVASPSAQA